MLSTAKMSPFTAGQRGLKRHYIKREADSVSLDKIRTGPSVQPPSTIKVRWWTEGPVLFMQQYGLPAYTFEF